MKKLAKDIRAQIEALDLETPYARGLWSKLSHDDREKVRAALIAKLAPFLGELDLQLVAKTWPEKAA